MIGRRLLWSLAPLAVAGLAACGASSDGQVITAAASAQNPRVSASTAPISAPETADNTSSETDPLPTETVHADNLQLPSKAVQQRFVDSVVEAIPTIDRDQVVQQGAQVCWDIIHGLDDATLLQHVQQLFAVTGGPEATADQATVVLTAARTTLCG